MKDLPEFFQKMVCFGVAVCEILRVEIKKTAFSRVDVLLITIIVQQSIAFSERPK